MSIESINALDEAKLLGYFESIKSVFLLRFVLLASVLKQENGKRFVDPNKLPANAIAEVKAEIDDPLFYRALMKGNEELCQNYVEDMGTSLVSTSWIVFEQITKDLTKTDYATHADELSLCYQNGRFQFEGREKKDIELFYYIRNAIQHYNGAYYAAKDIDHRYAGADFKSHGHYGEKIDLSLKLSWTIASDLERYTAKAWANAKNFRKSPHPGP
jgi:hypothetical protein